MKKKNTIYVDTIGFAELGKWKRGNSLIYFGEMVTLFGLCMISHGWNKQSRSVKWHRAANEEEYKEICDICNAFQTAFKGDEEK